MGVATTDPVLLRCPNPKCGMRFFNDTMLQRHLAEQMRKKKKEKMKKKKKEKKRKKKQVLLQSKLETTHGVVSCFCGRVLDSLDALGNHLSTHEEQDLATTHNRGLQAHIRVVKNKSFACDLCSKKFKTQEGVQAHKAAKGNHSRNKQEAVFKIYTDMYSRKKTLTRDELPFDSIDSHENTSQVKDTPFTFNTDMLHNYQFPDFPAIYPNSEENSEEKLESSKDMESEDEKEFEMMQVDPSDSKSFTSINLLENYFVLVKDAEIEDKREDAKAVYTSTPFCIS